MKLVLYFGHEIPESGGAGYDESYPDRPFTVQDLAAGLKQFAPDSTRFDLLVLSTCYGGTPYTIGTLSACARYIIASPDNLHLSYFDLRSLDRLDLTAHQSDLHRVAQRFAHQAFDRLTKEVETAVSVAVYDADSVQGYVRSVRPMYERALTQVSRDVPVSVAKYEHGDCADIPAYVQPAMTKGVEVFYRPARFGRAKDKLGHSGWECWIEKSVRTTMSTMDAGGRQP